MAEASVAITPGSGANIDAFQLSNNNYRQAVVIADPVGLSNALGVDGTGSISVNSNDLELIRSLDSLVGLLSMMTEPGTGRMRAVLDALGGAQTLANVTTVGTVSTITAGTITTVGSVTAVATLTALGPSGAGVDINQVLTMQLWQDAWANSLGNRMV